LGDLLRSLELRTAWKPFVQPPEAGLEITFEFRKPALVDVGAQHRDSIIVGEGVDPVGLAEPDHLTRKREVNVIRVIAEPVVGLYFRWHARGRRDARIAPVGAHDQSSPKLARLPLFVFGDNT